MRQYQFKGPIVRPGSDWDSVFIETTVGCTHNSCTFCNFYDGFKFSVIKPEEIERQLKEAAHETPHARKVWLSGGNPFVLSTDKLIKLAHMTRKYFPKAHVSTYARIDDINRKTADEIRRIHEAGIDDVVVGIESADDEVLAHVNKGYTQADVIDAGEKLDASGIMWRFIYLGGLAGKGKLEESARITGEIMNRFHPYYMYLTTLAPLPGTKLFDEMLDGKFVEAGELERIKEMRALIETLNNPITIDANTSTNGVTFKVHLPQDKKRILNDLDSVIENWTGDEENALHARRAEMRYV